MRETAARIVDLSPEHEASYLVCLEDWSDEMAESGNHKARWYHTMRARGLQVRLALDGDGRPIGMIQYLPIEHSLATGTDLYMIMCIWVHGHKEGGVGDQQGRGTGEALLEAAERDCRKLGAKGIVAWGVSMPFWMKAKWFKRHGYQVADRKGSMVLVWKPFTKDAEGPRWIEQGPVPTRVEGKVAVTAFVNGWCPASNIVYERAKRAAADFGDAIVFETIDTMEQSAMIRCGQSDCVFLDGRPLQRGAPPAYETIRERMAKRVNKLGL